MNSREARRPAAAGDAALALALAFLACFAPLFIAGPLWLRTAIQQAGFLSAVVLTIVLRRLDWRSALPLSRPRPLAALAAVAGLLALHFVLRELALPVQELAQRLGLETPEAVGRFEEDINREMQRAPAGLVLSAVVLPAACEEALFRGVLLSGLARRFGWRSAIVATSFLFGAVHGLPTRVMVTALIGFHLGFTVMATRSLWPAILAHALNNALALGIAGDEAFDGWKLAAGLAALALCVAALALLGAPKDERRKMRDESGPPPGPPGGSGGTRSHL